MHGEPLNAARPIVTLLTTRRCHPTVIALVDACASLGITLRPSRSLDPHSVLVFQWNYELPKSLRTIRNFCAEYGIDFVNPRMMGKWMQIKRLVAEGVPVPKSKFADNPEEALASAQDIGFPVVLKSLFGLQSRDVVLAEDEDALLKQWNDRHRIVQAYLPEGNRCARLMVVGDCVIYAVTRVAKDGFHATYGHGRRGTLEPFVTTGEFEKLAVAACRAVEVDIAGVDLVQTVSGPMILEVNHRCVEYTDRALHGPDAVKRVAHYLCKRAQDKRPHHPRVQPRRLPRLCIVTGLSASGSVKAIQHACEKERLEVRIGPGIEFEAQAVLFWGLTGGNYHTLTAKARALGLPSINGRARSLWGQRGVLYQTGIKVPRSRRASNLQQAMRLANVVGYPIFLRPDGDPQQERALFVSGNKRLESVWQDDKQHVIEEVRWAMQTLVRVWVMGEKVVYAEQRSLAELNHYGRGETGANVWQPVPVTPSQAATAVGACRALEVDIGVVELVPEPDGETVIRVLHRNISLNRLPDEIAKDVCQELAQRLRRMIESGPVESDRVSPGAGGKRLRVLLPRSYASRGSGYRIWTIYALYREFLRRGHQILSMHGRFDPELVDQAEFVLQDPLHAMGFNRRPDRLNRLLYEHSRERSHLLRRSTNGRAYKRAMARLARRLGIRAPALLRAKQVTASKLPVVVKPQRGSLGQGIRLVRTHLELRRIARGDKVIQEYIDSGTPYAISARVITVADRVVAAAIFYNKGILCSNLARGGRAIALTGPGRYARLTPEEVVLLENIGIDHTNRRLPEEIEEIAIKVGQYYSERGVQMLGQDFVVDRYDKWYFLEVNTAFGVAIFNVTHGEGHPSSRRGFVYAGRVLERAVVEVFSSESAWKTVYKPKISS